MEWLRSLHPSTRLLILTGAGLGASYIGYSYYRRYYGWSSIEDYDKMDPRKDPRNNPGYFDRRIKWDDDDEHFDAPLEENSNIDIERDYEQIQQNIPKDEENGGGWITPTPSSDNLICRFVQNAEEITEADSPREREPVENVSMMDDDFEVDRKPSRKILILGLENSGKSALLSQLSKEGTDCIEYLPTKGFNVVCISFEKLDLNIWEVGGALDYRSYWKNFSQSTDLILFAVDSNNRSKFPLAKMYLNDIISQANEDSDFHIIATKSDIEDSASSQEIQTALGLDGMKINVVKVAVKTGGAPSNIGLKEVHKCCLLESQD